MIRGEKALRLAAILESLPDAQREAVTLRHLEGLSIEEIAGRLDRSVPATAGLIKRGLQALREKMSEKSWHQARYQADRAVRRFMEQKAGSLGAQELIWVPGNSGYGVTYGPPPRR